MTTPAIRVYPEERSNLYCPIGLRLIDEFTGGQPLEPIGVILEIQDGAAWRVLDTPATVTLGGVVAFPGLGRAAEVIGQPPRRHRVRLTAKRYRPLYLEKADGVEFDVHPYNDATPPAVFASNPQDTFLLPASSYLYQPHIPVLHGAVVDLGGQPVANALVFRGQTERALSDENGAFSLALRWVPPNVAVSIDATDFRQNRSGAALATLPASLQQSLTIVVS